MAGFLEATHEKWKRWCDRIGEDLLDLAVSTHIYKELIQLVLANPALAGAASVYWHFLYLTYVDYAVAAVRRQVKDGSDEISLARLLRDLISQPAVITREWFEATPPELPDFVRSRGLAWSHEFFNTFAGPDGAHVDPVIVQADLSRLKSALAGIEAVADRMVAHLDKRPPLDRPQPKEVHAAIEVLLELFHRYRTLVWCGPWNFNLPASVGEDWKDLFRRAWIQS